MCICSHIISTEVSLEISLYLIWNWNGTDVHVAVEYWFLSVTEVIPDITLFYALSEHSVL